jgi:hypothetical protein
MYIAIGFQGGQAVNAWIDFSMAFSPEKLRRAYLRPQ